MANHYKTLGISETATDDEIRKSFRRLAKKYHPDLNPSANARAKFMAVEEAYTILSDSASRRAYDRRRKYKVKSTFKKKSTKSSSSGSTRKTTQSRSQQGAGNYYRILGLTRMALPQQIEEAYLRLSKENHPRGRRIKENWERFLDIEEAYNILKEFKFRKAYDDYYIYTGRSLAKNAERPYKTRGELESMMWNVLDAEMEDGRLDGQRKANLSFEHFMLLRTPAYQKWVNRRPFIKVLAGGIVILFSFFLFTFILGAHPVFSIIIGAIFLTPIAVISITVFRDQLEDRFLLPWLDRQQAIRKSND